MSACKIRNENIEDEVKSLSTLDLLGLLNDDVHRDSKKFQKKLHRDSIQLKIWNLKVHQFGPQDRSAEVRGRDKF